MKIIRKAKAWDDLIVMSKCDAKECHCNHVRE